MCNVVDIESSLYWMSHMAAVKTGSNYLLIPSLNLKLAPGRQLKRVWHSGTMDNGFGNVIIQVSGLTYPVHKEN